MTEYTIENVFGHVNVRQITNGYITAAWSDNPNSREAQEVFHPNAESVFSYIERIQRQHREQQIGEAMLRQARADKSLAIAAGLKEMPMAPVSVLHRGS